MTEDDSTNNRNPHLSFWEKICVDLKDTLKTKALRLANGRVQDAEDLVQGTVCRILMYPRNPQKIRSPRGYMLVVMRNLWIDKEDRERNKITDSLDELLSKEAEQKQRHKVEPAIEPAALRILENNELRARMRVKQGSLTAREELLLEWHLEGYNRKEIAEKLGEDVRLVRQELNALLVKLRARLQR
jgi:RNA polymerase sigma factor (sigma-70 family)